MAKGQEIKRRIRSIKSILQVTSAMEMISSIKMRKARDAALRSKAYVFESWRAIVKLSSLPENRDNSMLQEPQDGKVLLLVITSDRGLAGSYNSEILRRTLSFVKETGLENIDFITMGQKGQDFIRKIGGNIVANFPLGQEIRFSFVSPVALIGWNGFQERKYTRFVSIHTHFESAVKHNATELQILPIDIKRIEEDPTTEAVEFKYEPDREELFKNIIRQSVRALTYQVILESEAAEHASRMVAMKNATDAAKDLREDFEFTYNQIRQQSITSELSEISAGVNAMQ